MTPQIEIAKCECGATFERPVITLFGARRFEQRECSRCIARRNSAIQAEQERQRAIERENKWNEICPAIYRNTDIKDPRLSRDAIAAAMSWDDGSTRGIGIMGTSGRGKTRALYLALRHAFFNDRSVVAVSHNEFSRIAMDAYSGNREEKNQARDNLQRFKARRVLLLDDLGKPPSTERADSELEELVEHRTSNGLPILWSANGSGEWLIKRLGVDRGEPLVRRLAEFCEVVTIK